MVFAYPIARVMLLIGYTLGLLMPARPAQVATRCFTATGQCIGEPFGDAWQHNGALAVFGFPLAPMAPETSVDTNVSHLAQWFERERLELHPENEAPYRVLLGRLGVEQLERHGRDWNTFPKARPERAHYYATTGHAIAPQFWTFWRDHGLDLGASTISDRESLALFGYPISEAAMERNAAGDTVLTQWFERARFEYHPTNPEPYRVLLGLLGTEVRNPIAASPSYENRLGAAETLVSYYNAVTRHEYRRAYSYWEAPGTSPTSTPPDYATFVNGYHDTASLALTIGTETTDAGAGNFWATVPIFLRATTTGGVVQTFAGCYVLHHTSPGADPRPDAALWKLNRARIETSDAHATPSMVLPNLHCDAATIPPSADTSEVVTLRVADAETYRIRLTDAADIAIARQLLNGATSPSIPNGRVVRGDPDVNIGYSWHIDPTSFEFVDTTIEVCDGRPSDVERGTITSDRYCPWSAVVVGLDPIDEGTNAAHP